MRMSRGQIQNMLTTNVIEVVFHRRHPKYGWNDYRRLLGTLDLSLLNSAPGIVALHFRPPTHPPPYNFAEHNLVICYDLFWQDWRAFGAEDADVITVITTRPQEIFWKFFREYLKMLSPGDKIAFMNKG